MTAFLADRFLAWLDRQGPRALVRAPDASSSRTRRSSRPSPGTRAVRPDEPCRRRCGRRRVEAEGCAASLARGASGACRRGRRPARQPARRREPRRALRAVYFGLIGEVDHHLGRILDRAGAPGRARPHAGPVHLGPWRDAGRPLDARQGRLLPAGLPRAAADPPSRTARAAAAVDAFTEHVDLMPTILERLGCESRAMRRPSPVGTSSRATCPPTGARPPIGSTTSATSRRATYETALGLPSDACALATRFDGARYAYVHFAGLPALVLRSDAIRAGSPTASPATRPRAGGCWRRRRRCCPGGCSRPSAASPAAR